VIATSGKCRLVFTDLDGSLLDHHDYTYTDALPQLRELETLGIPVIPASSKTRAEIEHLRRELRNAHPFIAENGAGVYIPVGYFPDQPPDTSERGGYWVYSRSPPRETWVAMLASLEGEFAGKFDYFHRAGTDGIARMTGLPRERAEEANQRDFSEPAQWLGEAVELDCFLDKLRSAGANVQRGGRFFSVSGDCDKGRALTWLRDAYRAALGAACCHDLAIGDSGNDRAMLEAAETALVIRSPAHDFPTLSRSDGVIYSRDCGPAGWAEGVSLWLSLENSPDCSAGG
jgi:mannosyl-3-phosphoglycerate phosphatase family protein